MTHLRSFPFAVLTGFLILFGASATRAQFSAQSFVSTPGTSAVQPAVLNVGQNYPNALSFTITFNQQGTSISTIEMRGGLPPGLSAGGTQQGDAYVVTNRPTAVFFGTPSTPGDYHLVVNAIASTGTNSLSQGAVWDVYFRVQASGTAPTITTQPTSQTVTAGTNVSFTAAADGTPAPTFQWRKDGIAISGATNAILTLTAVSATSAGAYSVVATNAIGSATSNAATLTVNPLVVTASPTITSQPISVAATAGGTVAFVATADGIPAPTLQWRKNGVAISGATSPTLMLRSVAATDAASYTLVATNTIGTTTSNAALLSLSPSPDFGRLVNLSILTSVSATDPLFTLGVVIGGPGTSGTKPLLVRTAGPSLTPLGVAGALSDPKLDVFSGQTIVATNDDWGGTTALNNAFISVGAFAYTSATSKDAATFNPTTAAGAYTVQVSGAGGATGAVIAELYDATAPSTFTSATPRLVNVSVLKQIDAGSLLTAGFVIGGSTAKTVLIRAIGPALGLAPFNIGGAMSDPKLDLFSGQAVIASNDNWGGDTQIASAGNSVGAFAVANAASKDAMLLITLPPGPYTAQASGVGNTGGLAIVEVYEVP